MKIFLIMVKWASFLVGRSMVEVVLGGWDGILYDLILFMVAEYLTQIFVAILHKQKSSEIGFCGIAKKVSIFFW